MLIKTRSATRRRVLRGVLGGGTVAVSLPYLDAFLDDNGAALAAGSPLPLRFGTWFWGLGMDSEIFVPKKTGADYDLPEQLKALDRVKQHVNVFTNYNVLTDGRPNLCHYTGWVVLRCGGAPAGKGALPGESLDVTIADTIGDGTRFRSLNMTATGVARNSYSFRSADAINPSDISAVEVYQQVFGSDFQDPNSANFTPDPRTMTRKSVLSGVLSETKVLERSLGTADRLRLDQYFTSIRELEDRLDLQLQKPPPAQSCVVPSDAPHEMPVGLDVELVSARHRAMTDLLVMALACNQTKAFNMVYSASSSSLVRKGSERVHHTITHEEPIDPDLGVQPQAAWFVGEAMREWAYFVEALARVQEGDGSLLDNSLVYAHSDCELAKVHALQGLPMFTAGRLGGRVRAGQHLDGNGEPATRVGYTIQKLMGAPIGSWGTRSMETAREVSEIVA